MKVFRMILVSLLLQGHLFAAGNFSTPLYKQLDIQAAYGDVASVSVSEIVSQSQQFMQGMPFNIEESYVAYGSTDRGREIARWSLMSNAKFKIRITASPMQHEEKAAGTGKLGSSDLDYFLTFVGTIGYADQSGSDADLGQTEFTVATNPNDRVSSTAGSYDEQGRFVFDPFFNSTGLYEYYVGAVDGSIYFMFNSNSSNTIKAEYSDSTSTLVPHGNYVASVMIEIVGA